MSKSAMSTEMHAVPLYVMIKDHILDLIQTGALQPNERAPSESDLVKQFGVSRMTVNRALRELKDEGVVVRLSGVGTFVADSHPEGHLITVNSIADEVRGRGHPYSSEVVQNVLEEAPSDVAFQMGLRQGAAVFHSIIVHLENAIPIQLEDRYVSSLMLPDYGNIDFGKTTPNEYLTEHAPLQKFEHRVRSALPDERTQHLLKIGPIEPCLLLIRRTWSNQVVVSYAHMTHPGSRYEFVDDIEAN